MMMRSEARTDKGWQGFDRLAGLVSFVLAVLLLAVSLLRSEIVPSPFTDQPQSADSPLSANDQPGSDPAQSTLGESSSSAASATSAIAPADNQLASKTAPASDKPMQAPFERIETYIDKPTLSGPAVGAAESRQSMSARDASLVVPFIELRAEGGKLAIDGLIGSEQTRKEIVRAALETFGMRNITDRVAVSAGIAGFGWTAQPKDILVLVGSPDQATSVRVDGSKVTLSGTLADRSVKEARALAAQQLFGPSATIDNRIRVTADAANSSVAKAPLSTASETAAPSESEQASRIDVAGTGPVTDPQAGSAPSPVLATGGVTRSTQDNDVPAGEPPEDGKTVLTARVPEKVRPAQCARIATGLVIPFRSGRSELTEDGRAALTAVALCLERRRYIVGGHTDSRGSAIGNLVLSQARAQSVVDFLVLQGVPAEQLVPKGYGETRPVDTNRNEKGRARNRRIDFRFAT